MSQSSLVNNVNALAAQFGADVARLEARVESLPSSGSSSGSSHTPIVSPRIINPSPNATVYNLFGITVQSREFIVHFAIDTHESTDWQICSDAECTNVVAQALESSDLLSHTFTNVNLSDDTTYYIRARFHGTEYGASEWSVPIAVINDTTSPTLTDNSWDKIKKVGCAGNGELFWDIGDMKAVTLNGTIGTLALSNFETNVFIIDFNYLGNDGIYFQGFMTNEGIHIALCDSYYYTQVPSDVKGFTLNHQGSSYNTGGFVRCDSRYDILGSTSKAPAGYPAQVTNNSSATGYPAFQDSKVHPVENTLMAALPSDLRNALSLWSVYADVYGGYSSSSSSGNVRPIVDYLPLLALFEVLGSVYGSMNSYEANKQAQMSYYKNGNSKIAYKHSDTTTACYWWTRSPTVTSTSRTFELVDNTGYYSQPTPTYAFGMSPAFKIGKDLVETWFCGYKLWRHESNKGSVLEAPFGDKVIQLFIADAKYRTNLQFSVVETDNSLTNFNQQNVYSYWYLAGGSSNSNQYAEATSMCYQSFSNIWGSSTPSILNDLTARENCDVWITQPASSSVSQAVGYVRSLSIDGISGGCDIPNLIELMLIFTVMNHIDILDPTVYSYPEFALGTLLGNVLSSGISKRWNFDGTDFAWSSTKHSAGNVRCIKVNSECSYNPEDTVGGVIPVRELSIITNS